ncbi:O-acetyl-ADP-ribose deacetylase [Kitasatospora sp. NPDC094015]|uniref:O-acetyl-ADP-ribose deacetylase n=1 Tax=Kitasatospora sp. NPDC094015 TaxID=3155205 RepID=UPI0033237A3E
MVVTRITLVQGDITEQQVDVIVNAANSSLLGGGGVDGAIHRKGGPEILADCRRLRASHYGGGLDAGRAVATTAGRLPARSVVHTVGPVHQAADYEQRAELLASCYRESLRLAAELGARTVAFPAISTGVYRWPMEDAARIALTAVTETVAVPDPPAAWPDEVRFVLFGAEAYEVFERALRELRRPAEGAER